MEHLVNQGQDLQAALNAAQPGDHLVVQGGATFVTAAGYKLPAKPAGAPIVVRSSAPLPDRQIGPADRGLLPKIGSGSAEPALEGKGAKGWRFDGIEFLPCKDGMYNVIYTWEDADDLTWDRILIVGGPKGQKDAVSANGGHITLTRSHLANIYQAGAESHGFRAWEGPGPFTITDNYIEAAAINILFGGADSRSADRIPADILVARNHLFKRPEWKGTGKAIKNLFELKNAKRVVVQDNVMEHNYSDAQSGWGIVFTVRSESGEPWSTIEDVVFERNQVLDTEGGVNFLGINDGPPSGQLTRVKVVNNLFLCTNGFFQLGGENGEVVIEHNTIVNKGNKLGTLYYGLVWPAGEPAARKANYAVRHLTYRNNLGYRRSYGVFGDGDGQGTTALETFTEGYAWTNNVLAGTKGTYPPVTWFPTIDEHEAQFEPDYTLKEGSPYRTQDTDGGALGGDWRTPEPPAPEPPPIDTTAILKHCDEIDTLVQMIRDEITGAPDA